MSCHRAVALAFITAAAACGPPAAVPARSPAASSSSRGPSLQPSPAPIAEAKIPAAAQAARPALPVLCSPPPTTAPRFPIDFAPLPPASPDRIRRALGIVRDAFPEVLADVALDSSDDQSVQCVFEERDVPAAYASETAESVQRCLMSVFKRLDIPQLPSCSHNGIR